MEEHHKDHAVRNVAKVHILLAHATDVKQHPEDQAWAQLVERLEVKAADTWVELPPNKPIKQHVASVAAQGQEFVSLEGPQVYPHCLHNGIGKRRGE